MEGVSEDGDDLFSIVCGDLGLGESTRGTNYLKFGLGQGQTPLSVSDSCLHGDVKYLPFSSEHQNDTSNSDISPQDDQSKYFDHSSSSHVEGTKSRRGGECSSMSVSMEDFPTYADVPYGTSLRQQKKLYEQQIDSLRRQFAASHSGDSEAGSRKDSRRSSSFKMTGKEIENKLVVALQEMDELKIELEACRKRLDAKYKAVAILKEQADLADTQLKTTERRASETSRRLEQEVSKLQFELEWRESSFIDSQQTWAERFDRVCQENSILMSKLEARNEELRRANAHKSAIARERDELLALLDVTERLKYEQGKSKIAEEEYGSFSSSELAVLGACKCRVSSPEPCGCAHAAANLRKEVAKLREELELLQQRREEANLTVDAYRSAFEEQLSRCRNMSSRLSQIATMSSRSAKAKAAIKWLIQVLNDDDYVPPRPAEQGVEAEKGNQLSNMSLQELVNVLTDMVHEKNEALAHQKLAAQVLANKLHMYEKKDEKRLDDTEVNSRPRRNKHKQPKRPQTVTNDKPELDYRDSTDDTSTFDDEVSPSKTQSRDDEVFKYIVGSSHHGDADELEDGDKGELTFNSSLEMSHVGKENDSKNVTAAGGNTPADASDKGENTSNCDNGAVETVLNAGDISHLNDTTATVSDDTTASGESDGDKLEINNGMNTASDEIKASEEAEMDNSINNHLESNCETATKGCPEVDQNKSQSVKDYGDEMNDKDPPLNVT